MGYQGEGDPKERSVRARPIIHRSEEERRREEMTIQKVGNLRNSLWRLLRYRYINIAEGVG